MPGEEPACTRPSSATEESEPVSKKSAKSDRQAVIEQIRKKQRSADQRRGFMIVGVCAVLALLIVGAAAFKPVKDWWDVRQFKGKNLAAIGAFFLNDTATTEK